MYGFAMTDGNLLSYYNTNIVFGTSYTENNGTYTLSGTATTSKANWFKNYGTYNNYYTCGDNTTSCTDLKRITAVYDYYYYSISSVNDYTYASGFTYDNDSGTYTLNNNTVRFWDIVDSANRTSLNTHHYTCFNQTGNCEALGYIYFISEPNASSNVYYISLIDGKNATDALNEMLNDSSVNQINSTMKTAIDAWYKRYMINFTSKLEDTIFCNDRSITNLGGWDSGSGDATSSLQFKNYNLNNDLSCTNLIDKFSLSNASAQLTYPVGLMTSSEMNILNNANIRKTGQQYWLLSPKYYTSSTFITVISTTGGLHYVGVSSLYGIRPAISLIPGTKYSSGNGSMADPYIVSDYISNTSFTDGAISGGSRNVTITFPSGCGSGLTCSYKKDNGSSVNVTSSSVVVNFTSPGILSTTVSDSEASLSNSHLVRFNAIYVSSSGNDTSGNGSIATPYKTLVKAYDMTEDTATIYVMNNITVSAITTLDRHKNITLTSCTKSGDTCPTSSANSIIRGSGYTGHLIHNRFGTLNLNTITIDGNNISAEKSLILNRETLNINTGTTIKRGVNSTNGGGIYNYETINLNAGTISNNQAGSGGGIYSASGTLNISSGTITNNTSTVTGGGIWVAGNLKITGGNITSNTSGNGGGIQCTYHTPMGSACNMTMSGGSISSNHSIGAATRSGQGGGIFVNSDLDTLIPTLSLTGGTISNNTANTSCTQSSCYAGGGGIHNKADLTLGAVTISSNEALTGGGGVQNSGTLTIQGATITGNTAGYGGGVNNTLVDSTHYGNTTMTSGTISNNTATTANGKTGNGGGLRSTTGIVTISGGTITGNIAEGAAGGVNLTYDSTDSAYTSTNTKKGKLNISGGTISNNTASTSGGGIYINYNDDHQSVCTISGSAKINSNTATNNNGGGIMNYGILKLQGGTIASNTAKVRGGGIYTSKTLTMTGGTIGGSSSSAGNKTTSGAGGGIMVYSGTASFTGGTIGYNTASSYGGGIYVQTDTTVTMSGTTVTTNTATSNAGGGINVAGTFTLNGSAVITSNKAPNGKGGGVNVLASGVFTQNGSIIKKNTASTSGGISVTNGGTYSRPGGNGYVCKNNSPTNSYDTTDTSNTNCS